MGEAKRRREARIAPRKANRPASLSLAEAMVSAIESKTRNGRFSPESRQQILDAVGRSRLGRHALPPEKATAIAERLAALVIGALA
jgi:hypothetical protein